MHHGVKYATVCWYVVTESLSMRRVSVAVGDEAFCRRRCDCGLTTWRMEFSSIFLKHFAVMEVVYKDLVQWGGFSRDSNDSFPEDEDGCSCSEITHEGQNREQGELQRAALEKHPVDPI